MNNFTIERLAAYHTHVGEDFCDQEGYSFNPIPLAEWLITRHPEYEVDLLEAIVNDEELLSLKHIFEENNIEDSYKGEDLFYNEFIEYMNQNTNEVEVKEFERILTEAEE